MKPLLKGYEIRLVNTDSLGRERPVDPDGRFGKITPYFEGKPLTEGRWPAVYGYWLTIRWARRICRLHHKYNVK